MKLESQVIASSETFKTNLAGNLEALNVVEEAAQKAAIGGGDAARERHLSRGKMLPRNRVAGLFVLVRDA